MTVVTNKNLKKAKQKKDDEFYTLYTDIERELVHYTTHFKDKTIYCNCDDETSEFYHYFKDNFKALGLKKLILTSYNREPFGQGKMIEYDGTNETVNTLLGDGSFNSVECAKILGDADIVVTNPPFSLFRDYINLLMQYKKKFLIIGNNSATTYREVFPFFKNNEIWYGVTSRGLYFKRPDTDELAWVNANWYTNLKHDKMNKPLVLTKRYNPNDYPELDNYHAIAVSKFVDIPFDYDGVMAVPITYLSHHCPEQFEVLWHSDRGSDGQVDYLKKSDWKGYFDTGYLNGKKLYTRLFIKKK